MDDRGGRTKKLTPPLYLAIIDEARKINKVYLRGQEVDRAALRSKWQARL